MSMFPPDVCDYGLIIPFPDFQKNPWIFESVKRCARDAIDVYNNTYVSLPSIIGYLLGPL